jgi:hypothetical protein
MEKLTVDVFLGTMERPNDKLVDVSRQEMAPSHMAGNRT